MTHSLSFIPTANTLGVGGTHTTDGRPPAVTAITPFIVVRNARQALEFYASVFGATVTGVVDTGEIIAHSVLDFGGNGQLQCGDAMPDYHLIDPPEGDDVCYSLALYVPDVDAVLARAVAAGAVVREPAANFVSGDRFASIRDPFGVRWSLMSRVEDLSPDESDARVAEWAAAGMPAV